MEGAEDGVPLQLFDAFADLRSMQVRGFWFQGFGVLDVQRVVMLLSVVCTTYTGAWQPPGGLHGKSVAMRVISGHIEVVH